MVRAIIGLFFGILTSSVFGQSASSEIFNRRILPLVHSPNGSSCQECHVAGIGVATFMKESEEETFAALVSGGWIDVDHPANSKLLAFVNRHTDETTDEIQLLRRREFDALGSWIAAAVKNRDLLSDAPNTSAGIKLDKELIRHLRKDRILSRFFDTIWADIGRCVNCHSPDRNERLVEEHGEQMSWVVPNDPKKTLNYLLENELIDLTAPDESAVRTKPTLIDDHEGGFKFAVGSEADKRFLSFVRDIANTMKGSYKSSRELPPGETEHFAMTEQFLKLTDLPAAWSGKLLQVDFFAKTEAGWTEQRVATADSEVNAKQHVWMQMLSVIGPKDQKLPKSLAPGRYRLEFFLDRQNRMPKNPNATFRQSDRIGTLEVDREWVIGYQKPNTYTASDFKTAQ